MKVHGSTYTKAERGGGGGFGTDLPQAMIVNYNTSWSCFLC